jgi:NAD(P)-dependent dehydrogenase (short-subunit alcohol dehydrogenase family)
MGRFEDKVAIVTGAAGGIGAAYAKALAAEGAAVMIADVSDEASAEVAKEIEAAGGRAAWVHTDISSVESTQAMAEATKAEFGAIDYLVNNAAIYGTMEFNTLLDVDWDYYRKFMSVNMRGGAIVNQSSTAAWLYSGFYGLAKVGINGLTQQLAHEYAGRKVRVNAIAPGPTDTAATRTQVHESMIDGLLANLAIKRMGTPDDMVGACLFLLSDDAAWITGQILNVDGGQVFRA